MYILGVRRFAARPLVYFTMGNPVQAVDGCGTPVDRTGAGVGMCAGEPWVGAALATKRRSYPLLVWSYERNIGSYAHSTAWRSGSREGRIGSGKRRAIAGCRGWVLCWDRRLQV